MILYDSILAFLRSRGDSSEGNSALFLEHAQDLADGVRRELLRVGIHGDALELALVAALLHQTDCIAQPDRINNPFLLDRDLKARLEFARAALTRAEHPIRTDPEIQLILKLIESVDMTMLGFPSSSLAGIQIRAGNFETDEEFKLAACLRAVDAVCHASGIDRAIEAWGQFGAESRLYSGHLEPRNASLGGNAALVLRRLVVDGARWWDLEQLSAMLNRLKIPALLFGGGWPEFLDLPYMGAVYNARERLGAASFTMSLREVADFTQLEAELRSTTLMKDRSLLPYARAAIRSIRVQPRALAPLSLYALEEKIAFLTVLHDVVLVAYGIDISDLNGFISIEYGDGGETRISPPIIEQSELDGGTYALVDGMHRLLMSERLGYTDIRVVTLENVSIPLPYLPVSWADVKVYVDPDRPRNDEKRVQRYASLAAFPAELFGLSGQVDERNYTSYFFRDLKHLGSFGMRNFR
jgi:hypothetical protein